MISIIIPAYNEKKETLDKCLEAVKKQDVEKEVIIVDDGSDNPIYYLACKIIRQENKGAAAARNAGLLESKGDFVFFLDADCVLMPGALEFMLTALEKNPHADYVYGKYMWDDGTMPPWDAVSPGMRFNPEKLKETNYISSMSLVRKGAFGINTKNPILWDESLSKLQDWDLWLQFLDNKKFGVGIDSILFTAEKRKGITSDNDHIYWQSKVAIKHHIPKVGIFMLTRDRRDYTYRTLLSLKEKAGYPFDLVIVDNGSTEIQPYDNFSIITGIWKFPENRGLKYGVWKGLDMLVNEDSQPYSMIMKLDNDCEIRTPDALKKLVSALYTMVNAFKNPFIAISPKIDGLNNEVPRLDTTKVRDITLSLVQHIGGICCIGTTNAWMNFRKLDYPSTLAKGQDLAFTQLISQNQGKSYYLEDVVAEHMDTTKGQLEKYPEYFERKKQEERINVK